MFRFGVFEVDPRAGELRRKGSKLKIQEQPFQILVTLLACPGEIVTREELSAKLWPADTFVDFDHGLNSAIRRLRDVLGDSADNPRFVETVGGRGYRFVAQVERSTHGNGSSSVPAPISISVPGPTPDLGTPPSLQVQRPSKRWTLMVIAGIAVVAGLLYWRSGPGDERSQRLAVLQRLTVGPLSTLPGTALSPTFSPDGSQVAFAWDGENEGKGYDLYVKAIGSDKPMRLTRHPSAGLSAAWSPDGRSIAFVRMAALEDSGVYLVPPTGGPERKLVSRSPATWPGAGISWSPEGKQLAYADQPTDALSSNSLMADATLQLFVLTMETLKRTQVNTGCIAVSIPKFSPHGKYLSWVCNKAGVSSSLWYVALSSGNRIQLLQWDDGISGVAWSKNERRIAFSSVGNEGAIFEVWLDSPTHIERLPVGHDASDLASNLARDGLAYVQGTNNMNIWRLDLQASPPQARKLVTSSRGQRAPSISPDGSRIAFESNRSGKWEVWVCNADGSNAQQLSFFGRSTTGTPRWSPDGKLIAFDSRAGVESNIYIVDPDGGVPRKLNIDVKGTGMGLASWSHDGGWLYFMNGEDVGEPAVWKVPSGGGHAVQIAGRGAYFPLESPDGESVYFVRGKKLWQSKTDGSSEQQVAGMPDLNSLGDEWFPSSSGIYFLAHEGGKTVVKLFDPGPRRVRPIFNLEKPPPIWIGGMPVSGDGTYLLYPQVDERSSNLMMIEKWQ